MIPDPATLHRQLVDDLRTFAMYLEEEVQEGIQPAQRPATVANTFKEILLGIRVLLPKLQRLELDRAHRQPPVCPHCD